MAPQRRPLTYRLMRLICPSVHVLVIVRGRGDRQLAVNMPQCRRVGRATGDICSRRVWGSTPAYYENHVCTFTVSPYPCYKLPVSQPVFAFCTVPDAQLAAVFARGLVEAQLAAGVAVLGPVQSVYRWRGQVYGRAEMQLIIKTTQSCVGELRDWITREHPYEVPEFVVVDVVDGLPSYLQWLATGGKSG